jgi:hypothetical protein
MSFKHDFALAASDAAPDQEVDSWEVEALDYRMRRGHFLGAYPTEAEAVVAARAALAGGRWVEASITNAAERRWLDSPMPRLDRPADARSIGLVADWMGAANAAASVAPFLRDDLDFRM